MNQFARLTRDVKLGIKAYQNFTGSVQGFDRFIVTFPTQDHVLLSSLFCFAVVKYGKPFVETQTAEGKARYPVKHLKGQEGFDNLVHEHLLEIRNTLIAHDDLISIEPRVMSMTMAMRPSGFAIPVATAVSNKCLAFSTDLVGTQKLRNHVAACAQGAMEKLHADLAALRAAALTDQEEARRQARYSRDLGEAEIKVGGSRLNPPNLLEESWLDSKAPEYGQVHNGLLYEELRIRKDFFGPEVIKLPDGNEVRIMPPGHGQDA